MNDILCAIVVIFFQSTYLLTWLAVGSTLGFIILCLSGLTLCIYGTRPITTPPRHLSRSVIYKCIGTCYLQLEQNTCSLHMTTNWSNSLSNSQPSAMKGFHQCYFMAMQWLYLLVVNCWESLADCFPILTLPV